MTGLCLDGEENTNPNYEEVGLVGIKTKKNAADNIDMIKILLRPQNSYDFPNNPFNPFFLFICLSSPLPTSFIFASILVLASVCPSSYVVSNPSSCSPKDANPEVTGLNGGTLALMSFEVPHVFNKAAALVPNPAPLDPSSDDPKLSKALPFSEEKSPPQSCDDASVPVSLFVKNDSGFWP